MKRMVIDCTTGEQRLEDIPVKEAQALERERLERVTALEAAEVAKAQRNARRIATLTKLAAAAGVTEPELAELLEGNG